MIKTTLSLVLVLMVMAGCQSGPRQESQEPAEEINSREVFLTSLHQLCDKTLQGEVIADHFQPAATGDPVSFSFTACKDQEIRINTALPIGEEFTIVLTLVGEELLLKHDIRNADFSPHNLTMYGGFALEEDTHETMLFPVHNFGGQMWEGYEDYSWRIRFSPDDALFEYTEMKGEVIKRHFRAILQNS